MQTLQTTCGSVGCASYLTAIVLPPPAVAAPSAHGGSPPATPALALGKGRQQRVLLPREGVSTRQLRPLKVSPKVGYVGSARREGRTRGPGVRAAVRCGSSPALCARLKRVEAARDGPPATALPAALGAAHGAERLPAAARGGGVPPLAVSTAIAGLPYAPQRVEAARTSQLLWLHELHKRLELRHHPWP